MTKLQGEVRAGFECKGPGCEQWIGDRRYVGPAGHAPQNLCFECWMVHWERIEACAANGGEWTCLDEAMWLFCRGYTLAQAAKAVATHHVTLRRWILKMCLKRELIPDWLIRMQEIRQSDHDR